MDWIPASLLTAVGVQLACQAFKVVYYSVRDGRFTPSYFVSAGGVPSAHAAFVTAVTTSVGIRSGVASEVFAVSFVFAAIVVYDAFRLRGHVQRHAEVINRLLGRTGETERVSEMVGHSLPEIVSGILFGGVVAALATLATA